VKGLALITGGAQGLGRAIAERLAADGMEIVIGDVQQDVAQGTAAELNAAGSQAVALHLNVADEHSVAEAYSEIERRFGRLDVLVNNAGVVGLEQGRRASVEDTSLATWEHTLRVNLTGAFLMCRGAVPLMRRGGFGRIVNISSRSARTRTGGLRNCSYAASKTALLGLTRVLAGEVGADGITVNCIAPSRVVTSMTLAGGGGQSDYFDCAVEESPLRRLGVPTDVAEAVAFFCSEESAFITGAVLDVNGGAFMP